MKRVVVDLDAGIDDIYAFLLLLFGEGLDEIKFEAITCVRGNTTVEHVYKNVQRILKLINKSIPVYIGENEPIIIYPCFYYPCYYGEDGFGDKFVESENNNLNNINSGCASEFINDLVKKNPKEISIICFGPLTNIALALKTNPKLGDNIKELFIMGGNYKEDNTGHLAEPERAGFNCKCDTEAVNIVLLKTNCPIKIVPRETCEAAEISTKWRIDVLGKIDNPVMKLLNDCELQYYIDKREWIAYDAYLAAAIMNPAVIEKEVTAGFKIELFDTKKRGQTFVDYKNKHKIKIVTELNTDLFKTMLYNAMNSIKS